MCGGRWGEVSRLAVDQVLLGDIVRVRLFGWKTGNERMVPAPPLLAEMLTRRFHEAKERGDTYLFPRISRSNVDRSKAQGWVKQGNAIKRAMERAGLNAPHIVDRQGVATIHSLRHTFASWLRQAGVGIGEIQELLGHQSDAMTRRYVHVAPHATVDHASQVLSAIVSHAITPRHTGGT